MQKVNYQQKLDRILTQLTEERRRPTLLLHCCCAPCSSYVLEYLAFHFQMTLFYYNPNIMQQAEYEKRLAELRRLVQEMGLDDTVAVLAPAFDPTAFTELVRGYETEPEGGSRCTLCYQLRLEETARQAQHLGCEYFTTTLSISPLKDAQRLNEIGSHLAAKYGVSYLPSDFKKKGGYQRSIELSAQYHLYRQNYCGCAFSKRNAT